jgi:hypothetical protein
MTTASERLKALSDHLRLQYFPQDWGIINADARRLGEFIQFSADHPDMDVPLQLELAELILASANELLLSAPESDLTELRRYVERASARSSLSVEYWERLDDDVEFPLGGALREWRNGQLPWHGLPGSEVERSR